MDSFAIHVQKDAKGYEPGSGGTAKTVGLHGGGLTFDLRVDKNYPDARKRWENQLPECIKRQAIMAERATAHYYTTIAMEVDPTDPDGSRTRCEQYVQNLQLQGWVVESSDINGDPMLAGRTMKMWVELRKAKTAKEAML